VQEARLPGIQGVLLRQKEVLVIALIARATHVDRHSMHISVLSFFIEKVYTKGGGGGG